MSLHLQTLAVPFEYPVVFTRDVFAPANGDDDRAPDFARTVEIHRKPGYDPAELFLDPGLRWPRAKIASILARRALGFRTLLDVVPLDATLVRGSHGRLPDRVDEGPLLLSSEPGVLPDGTIDATDVDRLILAHVFGDAAGSRRPMTASASRA